MLIINYNGVNLLSNTSMWWRDIYYYYIENNYMFRRLIMAIFRLYMNHMISSYTNIYMGYLYGEGRGGKWARDLVSVKTAGTCGMHGGFMLLSSYV